MLNKNQKKKRLFFFVFNALIIKDLQGIGR